RPLRGKRPVVRVLAAPVGVPGWPRPTVCEERTSRSMGGWWRFGGTPGLVMGITRDSAWAKPVRSPLSTVDNALLNMERGDATMNSGWLATFEGDCPPIDRIQRHVEERLAIVPQLRTRVARRFPVAGRRVWVEASDFEIAQHVRLANWPGGDAEDLNRLI